MNTNDKVQNIHTDEILEVVSMELVYVDSTTNTIIYTMSNGERWTEDIYEHWRILPKNQLSLSGLE